LLVGAELKLICYIHSSLQLPSPNEPHLLVQVRKLMNVTALRNVEWQHIFGCNIHTIHRKFSFALLTVVSLFANYIM